MKHLNQRAMTWTLAALLLGGGRIFPQAGAKPAAPPEKAQETQAAEQSDQELNIRAYIELLRMDMKSSARSVVSEIMQFDKEEADKFWPIYFEYELELSKIGDQRLALIKKYTDNAENMSEEIADQLAQGVFKTEQERHNLKVKYYERIKKALTAKTAARFLQVQNQILLLIDLQIASTLPVMK